MPICGAHTFHIPVMGTGFTLDTPLQVARFGISSVISLVDDLLIDKIHLYHAAREGEPHEPITEKNPDPRAERIRSYLDMVQRIVERQVKAMRAEAFAAGSGICRYFELLPDSPLRTLYFNMMGATDPGEKLRLQQVLREEIRPGSIDVNIMTKLDTARFRDGVRLPPEFSDALSALRGFARSTLDSAVVFSAGLNQRLYTYASEFPDFLPDAFGRLKKRIILKVSDFRSAAIQGRFLAKRGLWVSEFRIESGLNCGGHAFPSGGQLMAVILEEFKQKRQELTASLWEICATVWKSRQVPVPETPFAARVTVQGGVGTADEHRMLIEQYGADSIGWASPFLLAPDVTAVDDDLLERLLTCKQEHIYLSDASPLGVPFWNLHISPSEEMRRRRLAEGHPGSPCPKGFLSSDASFTSVPICLASNEYQRHRLAQLKSDAGPNHDELAGKVTRKSCICHELGGSARRKYNQDSNIPAAICPGPNLFWFRRRTNLDEMAGHIYGRLSIIDEEARPHMFIQELALNINYLRNWIAPTVAKGDPHAQKNLREFGANLHSGIGYYREHAARIAGARSARFLEQLQAQEDDLAALLKVTAPPPAP